MRTDWQVVEVKKVCDLVVDCINNTAPTVDEQTPYKMLRTSNIGDGRLDLSDVKYVSEETYEEWTRRAEVKQGDVLLTREAPLGDVAYVNQEDTIFLGQRIMQYRANPDVLNPRFLSYAFLSPFVQAQIHKYKGSGSTVDHIRVPECEKIEIPLPNIEYQNKVAKILGSLDKKIDKNRQMNQTLENLAQAIFEGHFVEFEPYNDFKETEKGPIPSEFEVANLPALMNIVLGGTPKSDVDEYYGGDITWAKAKDVSQETEAFISSTEKSITETGLEESSAELVPEGTTVITARGTVGETALTPYEMATNQTCYGLVPENNQEKYFLYFLVKTHIERLRSRTHGTVFDTINMNTLREQEIILPPKKNASNLMKALSQ
ncbi:restriction endonuclease subunit S [Haloarcula marismortui]|nr:restriction endonuclease subunit S [Haloarcula sinaiiensis]